MKAGESGLIDYCGRRNKWTNVAVKAARKDGCPSHLSDYMHPNYQKNADILTKGEASPFALFALWVLPVDKRERRLHQWNPDPAYEIHDA